MPSSKFLIRNLPHQLVGYRKINSMALLRCLLFAHFGSGAEDALGSLLFTREIVLF